MNITQETDALAKLLAQAEQQDKEKQVKPQCSLDEDECLSCGS